jgi:DUF4097 and DUF4098 domain-containing protein YvlB
MRSHRITAWSLCAAIVLSAFLGGCFVYISDGEGHALHSEAKRTDDLTAGLTDITALEVSTHLGAIHIQAGDVNEAVITAKITVRAKTEEEAEGLLEGVRISPEPSDHTLVIKTTKPSDFGHNSLAVDFTITVPKRLEVRCTTHVGETRIAGMAGAVAARTNVGKIECTDLHGGKADLATNVGDIKVTYADDAPPALQVDADTHVGNIDFVGPEHLSAKFSAGTHVGDIHTNREMKAQGFMSKLLDATLGSGEGRIAFHTHVGEIRIR